MHNPLKPYNDLPPLPPAVELENKPVLKRCVTARAAIAELRLAGQLIPDQSVLIHMIPLLEAKDSSEIENIVTTNDALFREASLDDGGGDPATKEALRYRAALFQGMEAIKSRPLTTRLVVEICRTIKGVALDIRATPGTTLSNSFTGEVIYTPPEGADQIRTLLGNWERFVNEPSDLDPLVKMAVQHYQFEAIHPFIDGNGRTGRVLNVLALMQDGLLDLPTLYLSRHILRTKADYYRNLQGVTRHQAWEPWTLYMLEAIETSSRWTTGKINAIRQLIEATVAHVRAGAPKIYSRELVDVLFVKPYCRIGDLVDRDIAKRQAASTYLKTLAELGVVIEEKSGRDKVFVHRKYLDLLGADGHGFPAYPAPARGAK
jgi:Fic family protein